MLALTLAVPAFALEESDVEAAVSSSSREAVAGNVLVWFLCAVGFLKVSQKIDSFMASIGVNVGHTGGSMLGEAMVAFKGVSLAAGTVGKAVGGFTDKARAGGKTTSGSSGFLQGGLAGVVSRKITNDAVRTATQTTQKASSSTASVAYQATKRTVNAERQAASVVHQSKQTNAARTAQSTAHQQTVSSLHRESQHSVGLGGRLFANSLLEGGRFANDVIGMVAAGDLHSTGSITGEFASQALSSYMGITAQGDAAPQISYAFGFEGESYAHYKQEKDDALNQAADHSAALPDTSPAEEPVSSEAPNPAEDVDDVAPSDEIEDTAGEAAAEPTSENSDILGTEPVDAETPDSENDDTDVAAADDTAAALNQETVSEEADHSDETAAPADDVINQPEESEGTDAQTPEDTQEETPAESIPEETDESVDEAPEDASTEKPAEQPEDYVELEDESAVLLGDTAFFSDRDAAGGETIQNIFLWDGYVENDGKVFKPDYEPGRYVIVMQPVNPATAPYNSFLAFEVVDSEDISDTFQNINSYENFLEIVNELACPAEPVDLLTGSFKWEYTDFSLYGDHDLPFTRYYESKDAAFEHGFGCGWSTDYTAELEFHDLYTTARKNPHPSKSHPSCCGWRWRWK